MVKTKSEDEFYSYEPLENSKTERTAIIRSWSIHGDEIAAAYP
jgi:hypothetical protein